MTEDYTMQAPEPLTEDVIPRLPPSSEASLPEQDRELNFVLEISNMKQLGDPCEDDKESNGSCDEIKNKKTQNMTECVPVPSSEHVAEIVGRQGCKIKALRQKTSTYIKTPVRGEEAVFVVTGRKEDVALARREIQSAADHFTQIRATRKHALGDPSMGFSGCDGTVGFITLQVRVPYKVVGLVVGPKGATIKRIQQQTHTYIVTPSRDKEPVFEVSGLPENVEKAKEEIESHIAFRTGPQQSSIDDDFRNNGTEVGSPLMHDMTTYLPNPMLCHTGSIASSSFTPCESYSASVLRPGAPGFVPSSSTSLNANRSKTINEQFSRRMTMLSNLAERQNRTSFSQFKAPITSGLGVEQGFRAIESRITSTWPTNTSTSSTSSFAFGSRSGSDTSCLSSIFSDKDKDYASVVSGSNPQQRSTRLASLESSSSASGGDAGGSLPLTIRTSSRAGLALTIESGYSTGGTTSPAGSPVGISQSLSQCNVDDSDKVKLCIVCNDVEVDSALVPCGHHKFCISCATNCASLLSPTCPYCQQPVTLALRIKK